MARCGSTKRIWRDINMFEDIVELLGRRNSPGSSPNTFSVARLPFPPKLCWMRVEGPPPPSFNCHYTRLELLNNLIEDRSRSLGLPALDFSFMGTVWPGQPGVRPIADPLAWRESTYEKMLHLNDEYRVLCNRKVISYFAELPATVV